MKMDGQLQNKTSVKSKEALGNTDASFCVGVLYFASDILYDFSSEI